LRTEVNLQNISTSTVTIEKAVAIESYLAAAIDT